MRNIGLLGGSFNPVHYGHLMMAQNALETFDLLQVWFIPSMVAPHKVGTLQAEPRHRLAMLRLATEHHSGFEVCDAEIRRGGISYTADTLRWLRANNADARFHFIIGSDTLAELHAWKEAETLPTLCDFIVFERPGCELDSLAPDSLGLPAEWAKTLLERAVAGIRMDLASSDIRHRVAEGMSIRYMVPPEVEMYIQEHSLYQ